MGPVGRRRVLECWCNVRGECGGGDLSGRGGPLSTPLHLAPSHTTDLINPQPAGGPGHTVVTVSNTGVRRDTLARQLITLLRWAVWITKSFLEESNVTSVDIWIFAFGL